MRGQLQYAGAAILSYLFLQHSGCSGRAGLDPGSDTALKRKERLPPGPQPTDNRNVLFDSDFVEFPIEGYTIFGDNRKKPRDHDRRGTRQRETFDPSRAA